MRRALLILAAAVLATGCGNDRTEPPDIGEIGRPLGFQDARFAEHGIALRAPLRWRTVPGDPPQVATIATGEAQIALWRYRRTEPLPRTRAQLESARDELLRAVRTRDDQFELKSNRIVIKPGVRGVELVAEVTNQGSRRGVRSLHVFGHGAEVVLDAFAPAEDFARVDKETFAPVARSLKLTKPRS